MELRENVDGRVSSAFALNTSSSCLFFLFQRLIQSFPHFISTNYSRCVPFVVKCTGGNTDGKWGQYIIICYKIQLMQGERSSFKSSTTTTTVGRYRSRRLRRRDSPCAKFPTDRDRRLWVVVASSMPLPNAAASHFITDSPVCRGQKKNFWSRRRFSPFNPSGAVPRGAVPLLASLSVIPTSSIKSREAQ